MTVSHPLIIDPFRRSQPLSGNSFQLSSQMERAFTQRLAPLYTISEGLERYAYMDRVLREMEPLVRQVMNDRTSAPPCGRGTQSRRDRGRGRERANDDDGDI